MLEYYCLDISTKAYFYKSLYNLLVHTKQVTFLHLLLNLFHKDISSLRIKKAVVTNKYLQCFLIL